GCFFNTWLSNVLLSTNLVSQCTQVLSFWFLLDTAECFLFI
ncbi:unnamed protein product, partial [Callosobruchus maculatus]